MIPALDDDVGDSPVGDLDIGFVRAARMSEPRSGRQSHDHALGEESAPVRSRDEEPPWRPNDVEPVGDGGQQLGKRSSTRPEELVGVRADHPVGSVLRRRHSSHAGPERLRVESQAVLAYQVEHTLTLVALEDLPAPVLRTMIGRDHEVDACVQVEDEGGLHDVGLVTDEEGQDEHVPRFETVTR